jgi:hypothetical protein
MNVYGFGNSQINIIFITTTPLLLLITDIDNSQTKADELWSFPLQLETKKNDPIGTLWCRAGFGGEDVPIILLSENHLSSSPYLIPYPINRPLHKEL